MKTFLYAYLFQMKEILQKKAFIVTTLIMVLAIQGSVYWNYQSKEANHKKTDVYVSYEDTVYQINEEQFKEQMGDSYKLNVLKENEKDVLKQIQKGEYSSVYLLSQNGELPVIKNVYKQQNNPAVSMWIEQHMKEQYITTIANKRNISKEDVQLLLTPVQTEYIEQGNAQQTFGLVYPMVFLMYIFIMGFGQSIAVNVVSEKSSKVMEILLPKIHPIYSLYSKIVAALTTGLIQFGLLALSFWLTIQFGWVNGDVVNMFGFQINLHDLSPQMIFVFIFFFISGFMFYGLLYAAIGSMVSKVEDLHPVLTPIVFLLMTAFGVGVYTIFDPASTIAVIGSYFPPFTPIVLLSRILLDEASLVNIIGSLTIFAISFVVITYYCQKWYKKGVSGGSFKKRKKKFS